MNNALMQNYSNDAAVKNDADAQAASPVVPTASVRAEKAAGAFRTISEVADDLDVQQHVLRFWETKFTQVKPLKRGGGRRYYRPEDVALLKKIHHLLYTEGYTIKGVQKLLRGVSKSQLLNEAVAQPPSPSQAYGANLPQITGGASRAEAADEASPDTAEGQESGITLDSRQRAALKETLDELVAIRDLLKQAS